jgi:hypothetical protein
MDQMEIDIKHRLLAGFAENIVIVPNFLEHGAGRFGGRRHKNGLIMW